MPWPAVAEGQPGILGAAVALDRMEVMQMRVVLYTRISTDEENQPTSLHSQRGAA
jgi:hypothetical protein